MPTKRVALAISGGVDSSVSATLLKDQGYDVVGFFMKFWSDQIEDERINACCSTEAFNDAQKVCDQLGIKLYTLNLEDIFKKHVVDSFLSGYAGGITPNPCIMCNQFIKFTEFWKKVRAMDFDFIATGHYAQVEEKNKIYYLKKGADEKKDQSYFLYRLNQDTLAHTIFPVGHLKKSAVKKLAKKYKLPVTHKKESQEVCFVPNDNVRAFLQRYIKMTPGDIVDVNTGQTLGEHTGLAAYTIGQRKGIGLPAGPWYVVKKDAEKNIIYVTDNSRHQLLLLKHIPLINLHWISGKEPEFPLTCESQIRYNQKLQSAQVSKKDGNIILRFYTEVRAVTPGQSAVFYDGDYVIGGGVIV
jgi:tRNA-specific 2-thiouridylase